MPPNTRADAGPDAALNWVRPPKQQRARLSLERVLDAGATLLAEQGFEGFSVAEVCRAAAVSPGALYGRVASKDDLFLAIHERELARMSAASCALFADSPTWRSLSTVDLTLRVFRTLGAHYLQGAALLRAFILRAAVDHRVLAQGSRATEEVERQVVALLMTRAADYPHRDVEAATRTAYHLAADTIGWRIGFGAEFSVGGMHSPVSTFQAWVDQIADVCRMYLLNASA